jgi:uncharacterized membrane protein YqjE
MSEQSSGGFFSTAKQHVEQYIEARLHLIQLETTEKIARVIGLGTFLLLVGLLCALFMLCISLMAGYFFAQVFDSYFIGFALVAGFYLLLLIILLIVGKKFASFISDKFVEILFNQTIDKEENKPQNAS